MSHYEMIAREDFEAMLRERGQELEARRKRYYSALDVLPASDFESRDALSNQIYSANGEQIALRRMWDWVNEHYPRIGDQKANVEAAKRRYESALAAAGLGPVEQPQYGRATAPIAGYTETLVAANAILDETPTADESHRVDGGVI